jgi:hypothetical protein
MPLTGGLCSISNVTGLSATGSSCYVNTVDNSVQIHNPFGATGSYIKMSDAFSFTLSAYGTNPQFVKDAGIFVVRLSEYDKVNPLLRFSMNEQYY